MKYFFIIIIFVISNLSHSYENNQLLLNNEPKKVGYIELSTLKDKKINIFNNEKKNLYLINFWATWCPPCIKEIPELLKLERKYNKDIRVIFISVDLNPKKALPKFLKKKELGKFEPFIDHKLELTKKLEVKIMPTTLIIDKELNEISRVEGYIDWLDNKFLKEFEKLL
tara:strand:- start:51 stop:557 length:507 start_codon:yes stop_codon:yes gene_type:complete